jgi:hypothetical protein
MSFRPLGLSRISRGLSQTIRDSFGFFSSSILFRSRAISSSRYAISDFSQDRLTSRSFNLAIPIVSPCVSRGPIAKRTDQNPCSTLLSFSHPSPHSSFGRTHSLKNFCKIGSTSPQPTVTL